MFYNMLNEDANDGKNSRVVDDISLSDMSHFGVDYENDNFSANFEIDATGTVNTLWGKYNFDKWSLLAGLDYDGTDKIANQAWNHELGLIGWGAVFGGPRVQVRFASDNGFYLSLMQPFTDNNLAENEDGISRLIPMINIGYNLEKDRFSFSPTAVFQIYSYDKKFGEMHDVSVMSWLTAFTIEYTSDPMNITAHFNYGSNTGNMGYYGPSNIAAWDHDKNETIDTKTYGGFLMLGYELAENFTLNTGVGYAVSSFDRDYILIDSEDDLAAMVPVKLKDDARMGFYLQGNLRCGSFTIVPEFGMMMEMDDMFGNPEGTTTYFGTSLRFDF
jgi:outer membrane receptor protein involved in Fe transport